MLPHVLPLGRVAVGLPLHLLLPLILANTDVTSTDASSVLGATLNMILTRPQAPLTADSATGPAHGSRFCICFFNTLFVCLFIVLFLCLSVCLFASLFGNLSFVCWPVCLACLFVCLSMCSFVCLAVVPTGYVYLFACICLGLFVRQFVCLRLCVSFCPQPFVD